MPLNPGFYLCIINSEPLKHALSSCKGLKKALQLYLKSAQHTAVKDFLISRVYLTWQNMMYPTIQNPFKTSFYYPIFHKKVGTNVCINVLTTPTFFSGRCHRRDDLQFFPKVDMTWRFIPREQTWKGEGKRRNWQLFFFQYYYCATIEARVHLRS